MGTALRGCAVNSCMCWACAGLLVLALGTCAPVPTCTAMALLMRAISSTRRWRCSPTYSHVAARVCQQELDLP